MSPSDLLHVSVRSSAADDVPQIVALERDAFSDPWSGRTFLALLDREEVLFDVAVLGDPEGSEVAGYSVVYLMGVEADLANIAVNATVRRGGVGRLLLRHLLTTARVRGVREMFLEVRQSNAGARTMYENEGFVEVGRRAKYYVHPVEDALILRRSLW